ncbi:MAG: ATP-binding protein [Thermodesulfobacteriota bacterium]|nr:ATP-binding protein [Thermodesulfobacteriota bacterium]
MTDYHPRDITGALRVGLENMPVVVLTGMRQTGKTTFLRSEGHLGQRSYVSFDDFAQLEAAKADPDGFVRRDQPLTIDEAHKCPEIFGAIKRAVDKERIPGQFLLSGSANFSILKAITESLAGRSVYMALHPFNRREVRRQTTVEPFIKQFFQEQEIGPRDLEHPIPPKDVARGSMPTVCLGQVKDPLIWFRGYEQTYLERDVRELSRVQDLIALRTLLRLTALRTGQLLSPSQLGRDAKLSAATTSRYLSLFEASFLIARTAPYLGNRSSRLIKSPKLYLSDAGLAGYLAGLEPSSSLQTDPLYGAMFETYVAQNLLSIVAATWQRAALHFWAVQGRHEVDFVIEAGRSCVALELKSSARWQEKDLAGLKAFLAATPHCKAGILCHNGEDAVNLSPRLWALPISLILS